MQNNERTIPTHYLGAVLACVDKANRRASKLGVPAFRVEVGPVFVVEVKTEDGRTIEAERVTVAIFGEPIALPNFRFLGRVDFEEGSVLVNARPGEKIPARYHAATTFCDHCASQRKRNAVYIFRRDGGEQHVQVGRTCLRDFMGTDPEAVLHATNIEAAIFDELDEGLGGGLRESQVVRTDRVLAMAAAVIRAHNGAFTSKAAASANGSLPTSAYVFEQLFPPHPVPNGWVTIKPDEADEERAAAAKAWCLATMNDEDNDYQHNLRQIIDAERLNVRRIGLVTSLLGVYARHLGEEVKRAARVNAFVGAIGERREFVAKYAGCNAFDTSFGTLYIGRFETAEGLAVYKGGSPFWPAELREGDDIAFVATIKEHDTYKDTKQTLVQRAKIKAVAA